MQNGRMLRDYIDLRKSNKCHFALITATITLDAFFIIDSRQAIEKQKAS